MSREALIGAWDLVAFEARAADGSVQHPIGPDPVGTLVYLSSGLMTVQMGARERPRFASDDLRAGQPAEMIEAFKSYIAYSGPYEVRSDRVLHHVERCLFPNWEGTTQERYFDLDGDTLAIRTPPTTVAGRDVVMELRFRRIE